MKKALLILSSFIFLSTTAYAYTGDISINSPDLRFSKAYFLEGDTVRIYATANNKSTQDLLGVVRFYDGGKQIAGDQTISIFANKTDDVFIDWAPSSFGSHTISAKIFPWKPELDNPGNNYVDEKIYVEQDTDHDGLKNTIDLDDDGDGVNDDKDFAPLNAAEQYDTDGDGTGNNKDLDDDNDGVPDKFDEMPLDPNETTDTDKDSIGNIKDTDDDNDSILDTDELNMGTDPLKADTDKDKIKDGQDTFPLDPKEWIDTDKDSIGNNLDIDDDNDSLPDKTDPYPLNKAPVLKLEDVPSYVNLMEPYTFDATPSYDADGKIISFEWTVDSEKKEGTSLTKVFDEVGTHKVSLKITDDNGESQASNFQVNVVNSRFYIQLGIVLIAILLAFLIYFRYIATTKNSKKQ
ncbi:MAG: PKD domain-containing protein [Candidatus Gracilibacteria bacterium]